jgi:hypothetical protein
MAAYAAPRRRPGFASRPRTQARSQARLRTPPSSALIDTVLENADLRDDLGGGRVMLRLSPALAAESRFRKALGAEATRLGELAVIWDERDDTLFRVLDGAPPALAPVPSARPEEEPGFELTPAALEYIARSQSRGQG